MKRHVIIEIETGASGEFCGASCPQVVDQDCTFGYEGGVGPIERNRKRLDECHAAEIEVDKETIIRAGFFSESDGESNATRDALVKHVRMFSKVIKSVATAAGMIENE